MGFFDSIKKAVKKIEDKVIEPIAKDVVPVGLGYMTGGASLGVVKPSNSGVASKITDGLLGVKAGDLTSAIFGGGPQQVVEEVEATAQSSNQIPLRPMEQSTVAQQQQIVQSQQAPVTSIASTPQVGNNAPQVINQGMDNKTLMMFGGGALALVALMFMAKGKK